jgi:hypothetical protein
MNAYSAVDEVIRFASRLSPSEKAEVVERLALQIASDRALQDERYQRGYEKKPEETGEIEAILGHLPLTAEQWE